MRLRMPRGWVWAVFWLPVAAGAADAPVRVATLAAAPARSAMPVASPVPGGVAAVGREILLHAPHTRTAWYRLLLAGDWRGRTGPVLVVADNTRARLVAYLPPDYAPRTTTIYARDLDPRFSRHALVLVLPRNLRADQPLYLQLGDPGQTQPIKVRVTDIAGYQAEDLRHVRLSTLFATLQGSMLMVILCFWLVLRDRMFLYFIAYVGAQLVYQMAASGELYALPGAWVLAPLGYHTGQCAAALAAGLSIWFILSFADLERYVPGFARALGALRWPFLALAAVIWLPFLKPDAWLPNAVNLLLVASTIIGVVAGWRAWRRGGRQAGFFLLSWLPLLALTMMRVLQLILGLPLPGWLEYGFPASMAYAAVVITVGLADRTLQVRHERDMATRLAEFDPLTGALNRRAILDRLRRAWLAAHANRHPLAVLFLDLDHFKRINDTRGHAVGDACLCAVVDAIRQELGESDWLGRYGGEEFLIVLVGAGEHGAQRVAERIIQRAAALRVPAGDKAVTLTVSAGVAAMGPEIASMETLVECADTAQYRAKALGRNQVVVYRREDFARVAPELPLA
jgi:diguanylate cyclase (GGDEF)-like protein